MFDSSGITSSLMSIWDYENLIFQRIIQLLNVYTNKHSKTLVVRFDLTFPLGYTQVFTNELISSFTQKLIQKYRRQGRDPYYIWVREQRASVNPHYHFAILLNGQQIQKFDHVFYNAQSLWGSTLGTDASGQVHHCNDGVCYKNFSNGIMIRRSGSDAQLAYEAVVRQLSYLAKMRDKRSDGAPWRNFGMSQLY
jgi:hypothetical protein